MSALRAAIVLILAGGATSALAEQITCESHRIGGAEPCGTVAAGSTVTLARQLSGPACVEGKTWGTGPDHDSIWVSGGCRAVFDVQPSYSGAASNPAPDRYDDRDDSRGAGNSYHADEPTDEDDQGDRDDSYAGPQPRDDDRDAAPTQRDDDRYAGSPPRDDDRYAGDADARDTGRDRDLQDDRSGTYRDDASSGRDSHRYARVERRDDVRQACVDQAAVGQRFGPEQIEAGDARRIGRGMYSVDLDTPTGQVECTVDAEGRVRSLDQER